MAGDAGRPAFPSDSKVTGVRVTLRAPSWSAHGFSAQVPGFVFWYEPQGARLTYGTQLLEAVEASHKGAEPPRASRVHLLAHRYAKAHETPKDKLVWHCACLADYEFGVLTLTAARSERKIGRSHT